MKMNEYGTSRAENSSKSISKQFPIDWDTSQTPKSNQVHLNRSQPSDRAQCRVFRPTPLSHVPGPTIAWAHGVHELVLLGRTHELMHMGQAHELMLMDQAHVLMAWLMLGVRR